MSATNPLSILIPLVFTGLIVSGCTQTRFGGSSQPPPPLVPTPVGAVESNELQPVDQSNINADGSIDPNTVDTNIEPDVEVAAAPPPADGGKDVSRQALIGAWQVSSGGVQCQIFLALTKWSGGYRAATRGCAVAALSDVQAWDVKGKQVVLVNSSGTTAARLYRSADARYDGSTATGGAISFSR